MVIANSVGSFWRLSYLPRGKALLRLLGVLSCGVECGLLTNDEVVAVADRLAGLQLVHGSYGVHLGRDGVYRCNGAPFKGDPVGALALGQFGQGSVAATARRALSGLLGRRVGPSFCPGLSAGFDGLPRRKDLDNEYQAGYALGRTLRRNRGDRARMRQRAAERLEHQRSVARVKFFGFGAA